MYLAENLKFLREQNGKTQGELAVLFGIEQKTISSWECGSRKPPIGTIVSLAKLYRVYCYANYSSKSVETNAAKYDPLSPLLCGQVQEDDKITIRKVGSLKETQLSIFDM